MQTVLTKENGKLTVAVSDRVDTTTTPELEKVIFDNLDGITTIVLDLKDMSYISSAGLRLLLSLHKKMMDKGGMILKNINEANLEIFELTGFTNIFTIE
jgi:anti-sigma B factor antagonist